MRYGINLGCWNSVFAVPSAVVDEHIKLAGAASLKVLLYLLRHSGEETDSKLLSECLHLNESDVADALSYWISCGVLAGEKERLAPGEEAVKQPETRPAPVAEPPVKESKTKVTYSFAECAEIMARDEKLRGMLEAVEGILKKQLTHREISLFVTLCHWYGLAVDVAPLLAHYCMMLGKSSAAYIESTGKGWVKDGIDTPEKAERRIKDTSERRRAWRTVSDMLELEKRKPTDREESYCVTWLNEWHMSHELIKEAYEKCVNTKGKLNFSYMNGIMSRWNVGGIDSIEKLMEYENENKERPKGGKNKSGRYDSTHDLDEIDELYWDEIMEDLEEGE